MRPWLSLLVSLPLLSPLSGCSDASADDGGTDGGSASGGTDGSGGTGGSGTGGSTGPLPDPLDPLDQAPDSRVERLVPTHEVAADPYLDPRNPDELQQMLDEGWGVEMSAAGEPVLDVFPGMGDPPAPGPSATLLSRFAHLADTQLADDESPARSALLDTPSISGGFRPQEHYECLILNAAVRTLNAVHAATPLEFVVLGGDNADSAQTNEVQWFLDIVDGAPVVHCDSGADDDLVPGPDNDPKDPFAPVGLDVPLKWVNGNHDVLVQGNFTIASRKSVAIGDTANGGTRDWSMPGGPVVTGTVVPDPERALLDRGPLMELVASLGDGHGVDDAAVAMGKSYYTFDAGDALRFVVLDTAAETGGAEGLIRQGDVDDFVRPALDQAAADGRYVVLVSHHAAGSLSDGGSFGGMAQPDALSQADWEAFLGEYDNVVMHLCGHSHLHRVRMVDPTGGNPYWEVTTAALADWPHQMRVVEIEDQDNGFLTVTGIALDFSTEGDTLSAEGRERGIADHTTAWVEPGDGELTDRNVRLWWAKP